jgi:hypothetical protein
MVARLVGKVLVRFPKTDDMALAQLGQVPHFFLGLPIPQTAASAAPVSGGVPWRPYGHNGAPSDGFHQPV